MKRLSSWLLMSWLLMGSLVQAADYQLTLGQGIDVCEACKQNLERMTVHPACEREYSAQFDLESPAWKPFDVAGHLEAMEQVLYFLTAGSESGRNIPDESRFEDTLWRISTKDEPWAYWAQVDINNDGKAEPVLKLHSSLCHARNDGSIGRAYSAPIVVLTENLSGIDHELTDLVLQNPRQDGRAAGETNYQLYGVFRYKGTTYFDRWDDAGSGDQADQFTLSIYASTGDTTRKLCRLKELQAKRWFPGLPCTSRQCQTARPLPAHYIP
ncbi:MAG: hypothetical protein K1X60_07160 [Nitrospira sp.]|nr:hypothetical protein [Nitrospira sp.]MBX3369738.1 hypothetical protein [Nitrospira sp.]MBX7038923.1 hypothetical protein [Nitrospira sp.]MCW5795316.1 hypothetical protein [Nitrospira sp.]HMU29650.1 hypothetical protein [Nitrospira sp.]